MRYISAQFSVAIWIASTGRTPALIAIRTSLSRWPSRMMSATCMSSVQNPTCRDWAPNSVTVRTFSFMKCATEDSRMSSDMPARSFWRASSAV